MTDDRERRITQLIAMMAVSLGVVGYFVGLQSPMNPTTAVNATSMSEHVIHLDTRNESKVIPATSYRDMASITSQLASGSMLEGLQSSFDPFAEVKIEPLDKRIALARRDRNRAFNGAPPTIPHPIEQLSSASCIACHGEGAKTATLRIPRMSHQDLANCSQCHVESAPQHMTAKLFRENEFVGLQAPYEGPRAFAGAPPQIPHSRWMRSDCMSCHGFTGLQGIRTTHPWRQNCQQCHAPSASKDQTLLAAEPQFLPPPNVSH